MKSILRKFLRRLVNAGRPPRNIVHPERIYGLTLGLTNESARIEVWPESESSQSKITFGEGVCICKDVEITAIGPGSIIVGDHASFQDRCQIYGDVRIGAHCIFARNILVISTVHHFHAPPPGLISDQDRKFRVEMADTKERAGRTVQIEEDCWLGWGCAVMPGVYIGRGAVIGANCVVTRDVAPYEIHGAAPNRCLNVRLRFNPPSAISALDDDCIPYFYRGFRQRQADLQRSRQCGGMEATGAVAMLLAHEASPHLRIRGTLIQQGEPLKLHVFINGHDCGIHSLDASRFELSLSPTANREPVRPVPATLQNSTYVELLPVGIDPPHFFISGADVSPSEAYTN